MDSVPGGQWRPLTPLMRALLLVAAGLVLLAGVQLLVFSGRTDEYFAWTIEPPLTAAALGAAYWASAALQIAAARAHWWAHSRIAVPGVLVFTALTLAVTLAHLNRFHMSADFAAATRAVTWAWLGVYTVVPMVMGLLWVAQARAAGADPPRGPGLAGWLRAVVAGQAALLAVVGMALMAMPGSADWWPWQLTPLTARAIGAWCIGLAVVAGQALLENDSARVRPAAWAYVVLPVLEAYALVRYRESIDPGPAIWVFASFLCSAAVVGAAALAAVGGRRTSHSRDYGR